MDTENRVGTIDLMELLTRFRRSWAVIALCGLLLAGAAFAYNTFLVTPQYEASCRMIVITREDASANVTQDQLSSAQGMIDTYSQIILGRDFLEQVMEASGYRANEISYETFKSKISISGVASTQIMKIAVRDPDANKAKEIANVIYAKAPAYTKEKGRIGSLEQLDRAYAGPSPVSPNVKRSMVLAFLVGLLIPMGVITVRTLFENTYKTDMDIKRDLDLPVLGVIPALDAAQTGKSKAGRSGRRAK